MHSESLSLSPWPGASLRGENRFRGFYYTTQNPNGELERQVDWTTTVSLRQTLGGFSLEAGYLRSVQEGESPFRFDALPLRRSHQATLALGFQERPLSLSLKAGRDLDRGMYLPLEAQASLQDRGYQLTLGHKRGLEGEGPLESRLDGSLTPYPFSLRASLRFDHQKALFDPLLLQAGYALPGGSLNLSHRHGLNGEGPLTSDFSLALREGVSAYTLRALRDWQKDTLSLQGQAIFGPESLSLQATWDPMALAYTLGYRSGSLPGPLLDLALSGRYQEGLRATNLRFGLTQAQPEVGFRLSANLHLPEVEDRDIYSRTPPLAGGWSSGSRYLRMKGGEAPSPGFPFRGTLRMPARRKGPRATASLCATSAPPLPF